MGRIQEQRQKEHSYLSKQHSQTASHENDRATRHSSLAKSYEKLAELSKASKSQLKDGEQSDLSQCLEAMADDHKALAKASGECAADHLTLAKFHAEKMEECAKAAADDDLTKGTSDLLKRLEHLENTVVPSRISSVTPNAPGVTAVPRAGQRAFAEKPIVATQFQKLVEIEGD
jgi:hypothetical protein